MTGPCKDWDGLAGMFIDEAALLREGAIVAHAAPQDRERAATMLSQWYRVVEARSDREVAASTQRVAASVAPGYCEEGPIAAAE